MCRDNYRKDTICGKHKVRDSPSRDRERERLALQNGKVEGSEVGKNTALFLEAGVKSPLYVALCPDPPAREEREERRKDERQRGEREREEREMREMRKR